MPKSQATVVMLTPDRQIDRRILLQADSLEAVGWTVIIIAMPLDASAVDDRRVVRIGSSESGAKRENLVLDAYRWVRRHVPMNGAVMRWMKRIAWRYVVDQESFYTKLFWSTAQRYRPTVFVAHDLPMLPVASRLAAVSGAKLVYDSHELYSEQEFSKRESSRWQQIEAMYIGSCDAVTTVNRSIAIELERRYGVANVAVIRNAERCAAPPLASRRFHELFGLPADKRVLLLQGGLSAGRNLENMVDAMQHVRNASVVLVVLGDGLLLKHLQARARPTALKGRVYFHPAVAQEALLGFTAAADAGIVPYQATCLNNYYCTPNKLFEFIAAGIPVLGTDLPEIRRLVHDHEAGLVGDMATSEGLALLIDQFFSDEERFARWRHNVSMLRKTVCWEQEEKKLLEIYEVLR